MVTIARDEVVQGAQNDSFHIHQLYHCAHSQPTVASISISRAQMQALNATPIDLFDPPAGRSIYPLGVFFTKMAGAYGGGADVIVNFKNSVNTLVATISRSQLTNAAETSGYATRAPQTGLPEAQPDPRDGVDVNVATAFTGNGGELLLDLVYLELA